MHSKVWLKAVEARGRSERGSRRIQSRLPPARMAGVEAASALLSSAAPDLPWRGRLPQPVLQGGEVPARLQAVCCCGSSRGRPAAEAAACCI